MSAPNRTCGRRGRIGLIVPPTNTTNEAEWAAMLPADVSLHTTRMPLHVGVADEEGVLGLLADLRGTLPLLTAARIDVVVYACTAGSLILPFARLTDFLRAETGVAAVATAPAIVESCRMQGVTRIALATPYHDELNEHEAAYFRACGLEVVSMRGLGIGAGGPHEFLRIAELDAETVSDLVLATDHPAAQAVVLSCTDLPTSGFARSLEARLGKPLVTSNGATWQATLRALGLGVQAPTSPPGTRWARQATRKDR